MSMEEHLENTQERVEEAKNLVKLGEAYASAASGMQNVGGHAEGFVNEVAEAAYEAGDSHAERALMHSRTPILKHSSHRQQL